MHRILFSLAALCGLAFTAPTTAMAHEHMVKAGDVEITRSWARAMLPNQPAGGGYLTITNTGAEADRLLGASSPVAGRVEVHAMEVVDDVMTMRPIEGGLEIPADTTVKLEPGGRHLMFMMVSDTFDEGEIVPVTLEFEHAGSVRVELPVGSRQGAEPGHSDH